VGADVLIVDLEDSVAPADKAAARTIALGYLSGAAQAGITRAGAAHDAGAPAQTGSGAAHRTALALRLNGLDTAAGLADLQAFLSSPADPDYFIVPKTGSAGHLQILDRLMTGAGKRSRLVAQIESAQGLSQAESIALATPRLAALMFGTADLAADLGADLAWSSLVYSRSALVAAAALSGVLTIDAPFFDLRDTALLTLETAQSVAFGFSGKAAIHPGQVAAINAALSPTAAQIAHARAVLLENAKGVGVVDGIMVDEAVARRARRVLSRTRS
jgi:(S)-citramalyl-CoA lyase